MTYSVVARDKKTWQLWVAVQTHWFGVGNNVPWLEAGVWAVATQAQTNMDYGKKWLQLMQSWKTVQEAFDAIAKTDEARHMRQVAMMDNTWKIVAHTGDGCVKYADYIIWDEFIVQGNLLTNEDVLSAMKKAYEDNMNNDFAQRLYLCVKAWEEAGWELRWVQSAALRIVPWKRDEYDVVNLRIDDSVAPLTEIYRQLEIQKAYNILTQAEEEWEVWSTQESLELFSQALEILPNSEEILFWKAFMLQSRWKQKQAEEILQQFPKDSKWSELRNRIS